MTVTKIKKVCSNCGSTDVRLDAYACWIEESQEWELAETYENGFCMTCEGKCFINDEEIKP